ncbi:MAG: diguanylate cyclase [Leptolyngbya sp. SIO1D8]|nr:diguanylate cyclase [Leptolyngbya sp. SIO1D8]
MSVLSSLSLERAIDRQPPLIAPETSVNAALAHMQAAGSSYLIVTNPDHTFLSLITERDLVRTIAAQQVYAHSPLFQVMPPEAVTAHIKDIPDLLTARMLLRQHKIRHLPLINDQRSVVGTITYDKLSQLLNPVDLLGLRRVKEVMTSQVIGALPDTSFTHMSQLLAHHRVSCLVIHETTGAARHPIGLVTERDIICQWSQDGTNQHRDARDIMSPLHSISPEETLWQAHALMQKHHVRRLVVIHQAGTLAGIVTQTSLLQGIDLDEARLTLNTLQCIVSDHTVELNQTNQKLQRKVEERKRAKAALQLQIARERLVGRITQQIRKSLDLEAVLQATVIEISKFLKADRTLVYCVPEKEHQQGKIVVEAVTNGSLEAQGNHALEPILAKLDFRFYASGRIHSIPDLQAVDRSSQKVRFLRYLGIRSSLFAPIHVRGELWGLLNLNQHETPRCWEKADIKLLEQIVNQVGLAIEQAMLYAQLESANQQLQEQAYIDSLTQIMNRRRFDECSLKEWRRLAREQQSLSIILCDVDYFKRYNDTYGHQAGDLCLKAVAQALKASVRRPADAVARYGGEEFVILLPNTPLAGACHIAEKVRLQVASLQLLHEKSEVSDWVTISLGVASCIPHPQGSLKTLIEMADTALYEAKENGRNRWSSNTRSQF